MGVFGVVFLVALLRSATAQDSNCDFVQYTQLGETYYINNIEYPRNYTSPRQCRWIAIAPVSHQNVLDCSVIELPASPGCSRDRLLISRSGDPQLSAADVYCGRGTTTAVSNDRQMSIGLIVPSNSSGGRFYCQLRVQKKATTPACSCGYKKGNRIVGGQETGVNEYPMMGGLVETSIAQIKCGVTIIDKRYVVTAAHCVVNKALNQFIVVVGEHDVNAGESPATRGYNIERITIHPQYSPSNYDYDIALLRISQDIVFSDLVGPACLPFKFVNSDLTGYKLTFLGWGTYFFGGPKANTLQKVDVTMISQSSCQQRIPALTPRQLCTYTSGKDSCQDDSGGPGLFTDPATGLQHFMGIISYGDSCASSNPGVSTRVTAMLNWIQTNTNVNYCVK